MRNKALELSAATEVASQADSKILLLKISEQPMRSLQPQYQMDSLEEEPQLRDSSEADVTIAADPTTSDKRARNTPTSSTPSPTTSPEPKMGRSESTPTKDNQNSAMIL